MLCNFERSQLFKLWKLPSSILFVDSLINILLLPLDRYKMPLWAAPRTMRTSWACYAARAPLRTPSSMSASAQSRWVWSLRLSAPARRVLKLWS